MDRSSVQAWLDRYSRRLARPMTRLEIASLFTRGRGLSLSPVGRRRRRRARSRGDRRELGGARGAPRAAATPPGTYEGRYAPYAVDGRPTRSAVGTSTYWTDATRAVVRTMYHNVYLLDVRRRRPLPFLHRALHGARVVGPQIGR